MKRAIILGSVCLCALLVFLFPHRMVEPGELSEAHQKTGDDCFACHQPFGGLPNERCVDCHTVANIGRDTVHPTGRTLFHEALSPMACVECHSEHRGRGADIAADGFRHSLLSATIVKDCITCHEGPTDELHAQLPNTCVACHDTSGWKPVHTFAHELLPSERRNDCAACHRKPTDAMHERTSAACTSCHTLEGWKPAHFDHATLSTAEQNSCSSCHRAPADDLHRRIADDCTTCHGTKAWSPSTFDHDRYFRLEGEHNAKCVTCHSNREYARYSCYGCHEHTPGNIMSEHREEGITNFTDCVRCHRSGDEHEGGGEHHGSDDGEDDD